MKRIRRELPDRSLRGQFLTHRAEILWERPRDAERPGAVISQSRLVARACVNAPPDPAVCVWFPFHRSQEKELVGLRSVRGARAIESNPNLLEPWNQMTKSPRQHRPGPRRPPPVPQRREE